MPPSSSLVLYCCFVCSRKLGSNLNSFLASSQLSLSPVTRKNKAQIPQKTNTAYTQSSAVEAIAVLSNPNTRTVPTIKTAITSTRIQPPHSQQKAQVYKYHPINTITTTSNNIQPTLQKQDSTNYYDDYQHLTNSEHELQLPRLIIRYPILI